MLTPQTRRSDLIELNPMSRIGERVAVRPDGAEIIVSSRRTLTIYDATGAHVADAPVPSPAPGNVVVALRALWNA